ncbi:hypothetical protein [Cribrihabitans pelagius]|uniref:hypothetical protein n=1 Tax=Cribrihabitans pelagius TaxID=1765746 RepID=UPI003B5A45F2
MPAYTLPRRLSPAQRFLFSVPLLGRMSKEIAYGPRENAYYALATGLSLWASAVMLFGLPALYLPALALVPVIFALLITITRG